MDGVTRRYGCPDHLPSSNRTTCNLGVSQRDSITYNSMADKGQRVGLVSPPETTKLRGNAVRQSSYAPVRASVLEAIRITPHPPTRRMRSLLTSIMILGPLFTGANGAIVMNIVESNGDVVASTSGGTLDLSSLVYYGTSNAGGVVNPEYGGFRIGSGGFDLYAGGALQKGILGTGSHTFSTFDTGSSVGFSGLLPGVSVPEGYVSGNPIDPASSTWQSESLQSLGLSSGSYLFSWGTGQNADSITLRVIPEPSAVLLAGLGAIGLFSARRRIHHVEYAHDEA